MESAIIQPQQLYFYPGADLHEIAAADAFHRAESQAFIDGNKRTPISTAMTFLELNGIATVTATDELHQAMIAISQRLLNRPGSAAFLRRLFPA
jgi:death-on-curing protein